MKNSFLNRTRKACCAVTAIFCVALSATASAGKVRPRFHPARLDWHAWNKIQALSKGGDAYHGVPHWFVVGFMAHDLATALQSRSVKPWHVMPLLAQAAGLDHDITARLTPEIVRKLGVRHEIWTPSGYATRAPDRTLILEPQLTKRQERRYATASETPPTVPETLWAMEQDFRQGNENSMFNVVRLALRQPRGMRKPTFHAGMALVAATEFPFAKATEEKPHKNGPAYKRSFGVDDPIALYEHHLDQLPPDMAAQVHRTAHAMSLIDTISLPATARDPRIYTNVLVGLADGFRNEDPNHPQGDPRKLIVGTPKFYQFLNTPPAEHVRIAKERGWRYSPMNINSLLHTLPPWYRKVFRTNAAFNQAMADQLTANPELSIEDATKILASQYEPHYPASALRP